MMIIMDHCKPYNVQRTVTHRPKKILLKLVLIKKSLLNAPATSLEVLIMNLRIINLTFYCEHVL